MFVVQQSALNRKVNSKNVENKDNIQTPHNNKTFIILNHV